MCGFDMPHYEQFYVRPEDVGIDQFTLRDQESVHAVRVCRKRAGDWLIAVDGLGKRYQGEIAAATAELVRVRRLQQDEFWGEPRIHLTLAQGLLKGGHFEEIVEKATELGVSAIQPLVTERTIADPSPHRLERWREKARAAMKQCGRSLCPVIAAPVSLQRFVEQCADSMAFVAEESKGEGASRLSEAITPAKRLMLFIGPEGGFSDAELSLLQERRFAFLSLGARRLRSETAAVAAITLLLSCSGEMSV
jgi:16S rRNA (uracil1498-N3)-methyltransferase